MRSDRESVDARAGIEPVDDVDDLVRSVIDAAPDAIVVTDHTGQIVLANRRAHELFGYDPAGGPDATLVGRGVDDLLPESLRAAHAQHRERYAERPRARQMGSGLELLGRRADGTDLPVEVSLSPVRTGGAHHVVAAIRDLSERRAAQASLYATRERLALTAERERIGRDLHDSVIQRLYGAGLALQAAGDADPARLREVVAGAVDEIDDTIAEIRTVIHDLRHEPDGTLRLTDRVRNVTDAQAEALGIDVNLQVRGRVASSVPPAIADAVLAVVRECIANAHRHGAAATVEVSLDLDADGGLEVVVADDGSGFDPSVDTGGYGHKNLRARATELGGTFNVDAEPGAGTRVRWWVPLASEAIP